MIVNRAYKYRIYPSKSQITRLENQFSMCRHLYNWALAERIDAYQNEGRSITYSEQQNGLPELKKERPWFKGVHSQVLQDTLQRLDRAYKHFFRRVGNGDIPGFPKFKKRGQWDSITYPQYHNKPDSYIEVPKVGTIKLVLHRSLPKDAETKTLQIKRESDKWFACFCVEEEVSPQPKQGLSPLGIDLGLLDFYHTSDGEICTAPKYYRKRQKHLAKLQKRLERVPKGTRRWHKLQKAIRKTHYRIRCQRHDFLHKEANKLLGKSDLIFHEDLSIQDMIRRPKPRQDENGEYLRNGACWKSGLNKSIGDAGWGKFLDILYYKAQWLDKNVIAVPPNYTSQACPECGNIIKKSLSTRTHICDCGYRANRDYVAARNILRVGLDTLAVNAA